jgi:hypothetical protein
MELERIPVTDAGDVDRMVDEVFSETEGDFK